MAKKKIIAAEELAQSESTQCPEPAPEVQVDQTKKVEHPKVPDPVKPAAPVQEEPEHPQAPKKRIRIRKKAPKHVSVAVLCANPTTRRFI